MRDVGLSSVADLPRRATAFGITWWGQTRPASHSLKIEAITSLASIGRFKKLPGGPMVEPASPFRLRVTSCIGDLPNREGRVPVGVLELDRFLPGLLESSRKLVSPPAVLVFRPVSSPRLRPQGQRCARVGAISPLVVEGNMDLGRLISFPKESMGASRALNKRSTAPLFEVVARPANNCMLGLFLEHCHVTDGSRRV